MSLSLRQYSILTALFRAAERNTVTVAAGPAAICMCYYSYSFVPAIERALWLFVRVMY